jgi:hypothetical protein
MTIAQLALGDERIAMAADAAAPASPSPKNFSTSR